MTEEDISTVDVLLEFLEAAVHQVLFVRRLYSEELFGRQRLYGIAVRKSRHPDLNEYIQGAVTSLRVRPPPATPPAAASCRSTGRRVWGWLTGAQALTPHAELAGEGHPLQVGCAGAEGRRHPSGAVRGGAKGMLRCSCCCCCYCTRLRDMSMVSLAFVISFMGSIMPTCSCWATWRLLHQTWRQSRLSSGAPC